MTQHVTGETTAATEPAADADATTVPVAPSATTTRRRVLATTGVVAAAAAVSAACGSSSSSTPPASSSTPGASTPSGAGSSASATTGADAVAAAADVPVGGGVILQDRKIVVTQPAAGTFKGFSAVCTHQGCVVSSVADGKINCACHGSVYSAADGSVERGPATSPLAPVGVEVSGDQITLA